jgi:RNA polymerase sigma-70 factor (ECF subfamily)
LLTEGNKYEDSQLIALLSDDSEYAFQLLYDRHRRRIYQTALRYLKSPSLAQEVVQDVFLKLWFYRKDLKADRSLEAWLYSLAKNNVLNRLKKIANEWKAKNDLRVVSEAFVDNVEDKLLDSQYKELLALAISKLSEQQRHVFILARNEKLTYAEIGEKLNISPLTVKTHMSRALDSIRNFFSDYGIIFMIPACLIFL